MSEPASRPPHHPLVAPGGIDHHITDLTVTTSADVTLAELQEKLAKQGQWLPIDGNPSLSIGRLVETNSTGPLRLGYGAWRDVLLGCQFNTKSGRFITAGGRTMKNVAGYDLTKFMIGQYELFGRLLTLTTRTYKRPDMALLVKFEMSSKRIGELLPTPSRPQWSMLTQGFLWCGYLGDEKAIAYHEASIRSRGPIEVKRQSLEEDVNFRAKHWLPDRPPSRYRISVPPAEVLEFVRKTDLRNWSADPTFGIIVGSCATEQKETLRKAADAIGGRATFEEDHPSFFLATNRELQLLQSIESAFNG